MEENQREGDVGFPTPQPKSKSKLPALIFALLGVVFILVVGGWILFRNYSSSSEPFPSPESSLSAFVTPSPEPTTTPTPSPTPEPVEKGDLNIEIYNGTGIAGDASSLGSELTKLGYKNIAVKNADSQNEAVTTVTFGISVGSKVESEITKKLKELYENLNVKKTSLLGDVDIKIVTGPRKAKSAISVSPSPSATQTPVPTPTPTSTP